MKFIFVSSLITFFVSFFVSWLYTSKLSFVTPKMFDKWEKKNPEAEIIFDQSSEELLNLKNSLVKKIYQVLLWIMAAILVSSYAFLLIVFLIEGLDNQSKSIILFTMVFVMIPILHAMAFIYLTPTIGHKRIYNYKGRVLQREAFVLFSFGGFGLKHEKLMDLEYKEKHGKENTKYSLIFGGRMKIPVIVTSDIDKFNEFRLKVEELLSNVGLENKFQQ